MVEYAFRQNFTTVMVFFFTDHGFNRVVLKRFFTFGRFTSSSASTILYKYFVFLVNRYRYEHRQITQRAGDYSFTFRGTQMVLNRRYDTFSFNHRLPYSRTRVNQYYCGNLFLR